MSKRVGVIGLGNMGSGIAKNLMANGFETCGHDIAADRLEAFKSAGGAACANPADVAKMSDVVHVVVMSGDQIKDVIFGDDGLLKQLAKGSAIILNATIKPSEAMEVAEAMKDTGVYLIDSPMSGGYVCAQNAALTYMAAGDTKALDEYEPVMEATSKSIIRVGTEGGQGQTVKACLQAIIGSMFSATFEAAALAAKAGVSGETLSKVVASSSAGNIVTGTSLEHIIDRKFEGTGSHIDTMHKDLTIAMNLGEQLGVPLYTVGAAMQLFHAGRTKYPDGDNWGSVRVIEEIIGSELHR